MRLPIVAAVLCIAGCAGQPPTAPSAGQTEVAADAASSATGQPAAADAAPAKPQKRVVPERMKGPYKVVMRGDKKLYCTKELATGSHVNHRTICLTPEEYAEIERRSREWRDVMNGGVAPPSGPGGTAPMPNTIGP
jgi:hypothetical protein